MAPGREPHPLCLRGIAPQHLADVPHISPPEAPLFAVL
ncbi:hypothetical protein AS9A_1317 [Hoyosella subflava DQS3-9A1]|uniref:Uncharacterized protein n=1 Tax=Hoyosella subflava (strain DSM 45089 / JCM 17490 / NBRC 109087 / DQS3-9A1) TaxID=443218 RepID=F6EFF6_HOYSD|nr:hypothetical protein AS9A_1317 [Hoyosella subflava DQS3-9A1]